MAKDFWHGAIKGINSTTQRIWYYVAGAIHRGGVFMIISHLPAPRFIRIFVNLVRSWQTPQYRLYLPARVRHMIPELAEQCNKWLRIIFGTPSIATIFLAEYPKNRNVIFSVHDASFRILLNLEKFLKRKLISSFCESLLWKKISSA